MKVIIFGASGFIGKQLIPLLKTHNHSVVLVGRDKNLLQSLFPDCVVTDYSSFEDHSNDTDIALNLATVNSDSNKSFSEFKATNKDLAVELATRCHSAGIRCFLNINTVHALNTENRSKYAKSKRQGAEALSNLKIKQYVNVYLPSMYGTFWSGRLSFLNILPAPIARLVFSCVGSLVPTLSINELAVFIDNIPQDLEPPIILFEPKEANPFYRLTKRTMDLVFALSILILLWWLLLLIWIAIKLGTNGPGIFAQKRVGKNGREFVCYKFRTMQQGTAQRGTHEIPEASVTSLGHFLRKYKLDELPQIINILKNEMSLIGPRPSLPSQTDLIAERKKRGVFGIKPGISGYAQVRGIDMSNPILLAKTDATYIALRGLILDAKVVVKTVLGRGNGDHTQSREE